MACKSWASSLDAKEAHAVFECIAHNLLVLFEQRIVDEEVLCDEVEQNRQIGRTRENPDDIAPVNDERNFINSAVTRATQRTQRFIRWISGPHISTSSLERIYRSPARTLAAANLKVFHTDRLGMDYDEGNLAVDTTTHGPVIGVNFSF